MNEETQYPWRITICFDTKKISKKGYDINHVYDAIDQHIAHFGMERVSNNIWAPKEDKNKIQTQCAALSSLKQMKWVIQNTQSITYFEGTVNEYDFLETIRKHYPELLYS